MLILNRIFHIYVNLSKCKNQYKIILLKMKHNQLKIIHRMKLEILIIIHNWEKITIILKYLMKMIILKDNRIKRLNSEKKARNK